MSEAPPNRRHCLQARAVRTFRGATALAIVLGLTAAAGAPGSSAEPGAAIADLAGQLLVATPEMPDPRFARTVIYMVRHDAGGAQGFVVNRPVGEIPVAVLLDQMGMDKTGAEGSVRLHAGGPVESRRFFVLHTADYSAEDTIPAGNGFALSFQPDILRALVQGKGPRRTLFVLGYAGWGPGQLEAEIKAGGWVRASADEALVFDGDSEKKWERAIARRKIDL